MWLWGPAAIFVRWVQSHGLFFRLPGNDLARILRWGSGYSGEDPHHILVSVDEADEVLMDRWTILLDAQDVSEDGQNKEFLEPPKVLVHGLG